MISAATEASYCFVLISGKNDEAEMYDTINKFSLDLSDYKEQRFSNIWKFAQFASNFLTIERNIQNN